MKIIHGIAQRKFQDAQVRKVRRPAFIESFIKLKEVETMNKTSQVDVRGETMHMTWKNKV